MPQYYTTQKGDRWDQISQSFYGNSDYYDEIIQENPYLSDDIKRSLQLPAGIKLKIPDLDIEDDYPEDLPPWKR